MSEDPTLFLPAIEPFMALWQKLRISVVAVLKNDQWISLSTRIALSHMESELEFFIQPTPDFVGLSIDSPLSSLDGFLKDISTKGTFRVRIADRDLNIFLTLAYANGDSNPQKNYFGAPFSTLNHEHNRSFAWGESKFRLSNQNIEYQGSVISFEKLNVVSSKLRTHVPPFNGVKELLVYLDAPFDKHQNQTALEFIAPLPFSMTCSDNTVTVCGPNKAMGQLRVIGFFDTGQADVDFKDTFPIGKTPPGSLAGDIPWPEKSTRGDLFLFFKDHQIGSVSVRRWVGTTSWKIQVEEFFDAERALLKKGLEARKEQTEFELAVVRLLNQLRIPAIWYGDRQYQDRPDLAASLELKNEWIVVFGECTVQKPSVKFTPLLTRKKELEKLLHGDVRVLPVVFTSSTLSSADKEQARQDGIALVGADELTTLLRGVDQAWGPTRVIEYLDSIMTASFGLLGQI
jgi:hypothetical protein